MHFFEETFFRGAQKKDDLQFFFIRNTSHRYIVRDLTLETKETPVLYCYSTIRHFNKIANVFSFLSSFAIFIYTVI